MWSGAFKVKTVAGFETVVFIVFQPNFEIAAEDVEKFFAFVGVGFAAAAAGAHAEEVRLHGGVAPGEEFHADAGSGFENFALGRAHETGILFRGFKKGKDIRAIETCDAAKRRDRGAHLAAFKGAEKTDGDAGGAGDLREREAAAGAQAAETLAGKALGIFCRGCGGVALALEDVHDGGGIEAAGAAEKNGPAQEAHVGVGVFAVAALGALRSEKAEGFPVPQRGRRNAQTASDFADAQGTASDAQAHAF